ncbi:hypothetical protein BUALT_Bualt17G0024400 [Buddleja alternifolia]|uniref:Uncharacterized protein n=1 Tax=Buddleja alternifolia TaxID=168488 RepID=A0AAV6WEX5_9LAMI|nr:hypothetical protein BUALT_Bualt17G0024400 [Buddleja alternifolia]
MPPSPAMRISPGRELRAENHKRGRSLESGIRYREKDDDLALFNEVQNKERDSFLLQSSDDFDDIFSTKLKYFSDGKLGISIPARGESSDLLNVEGDKNDYDWLITPPETPLFASLDDETPQASLVPRGRPRSQPVSISRSSTMEKGYRSARGSPSPHRLSPSPRSGGSPLQSRSKPFSATHSSPPPPTFRHSSPSRKLSPPPIKSSPAPRSNTPTPRRMSTGSVGPTAPSRARGTSPIKTSRGNSASPKIKAWQSNIPGFSSEAPPNLRTSLADRPASYVRGSSPASRNGRQSMSPTASRSVSSSHSHERDPFSSYSKGSVASSGDDDVDSLQSNPFSSSDRSAPRSVGSLQNNRVMGFSKKPTKLLSSSAPKRSFDMALRQIDRKGPQNMFRPLLSSVPSSTFYAGKASAHHRSLISRNSSITTSSNASSDLATSGALDTEENEQNQEDVTSDFVKAQYANVHDEVFVMDQADDTLKDDVEIRTVEEIDNFRSEAISELDVAESSSQLHTVTAIDTARVVLDGRYGYLNADGTEDMKLCSICARAFPSSELLIEGNLQLCQECKNFEVNSTVAVFPKMIMAGENTTGDFVQVLEHGSFEILDQSPSIQVSLQTDHVNNIANAGQHSYNESSQDQLTSAIEQMIEKPLDGDKDHHRLTHCGLSSTSNVDVSEGTGISLLLKRSSSGTGHIVQNRSRAASSISYDDFSYVRDSVNSLRSSIGYSSASVSSSTDMGSSRQTEMTHIHRQPSWPKSDMENYRHETPTKHKRSVSSLSGTSSHVLQVASVAPSRLEDSFEVVASNIDDEVLEVIYVDSCEQSRASECAETESTCTHVESTSQLANFHAGDTSVVVLNREEPASRGNDETLTKSSINSMNEEISATHFRASSEGDDDAMAGSCGERMDVAEVPYPGSLDAISEVEIENVDIVSADSQSDVDSTNSKSCTNELMEPSVSVPHDDVVTTTVEEFDISDHAHGVLEESTIMLEDNLGGTKSRSLTLEEATDTILFCSSIVHNLAYEAANIAIDKESPPVEALRPTLTFVGKSNSDRRELRVRTITKRGSKSQKARQRKMETDQKPPSVVSESTEESTPRIVRDPSKDDSMKPPKLESKCNCTIM